MGTPEFFEMDCSLNSTVGNIIHLILKKYKEFQIPEKISLEFPNDPEAYELRLPDDEDEYYVPLYDIPELDRTKTVRQLNINTAVFCKSKNYDPLEKLPIEVLGIVMF